MTISSWTNTCIGEIAKVTSGGTPSRREEKYWGGNIPWITTGDIDFNRITSAREFITEAGLKNSSAKIFPKGTLLMAMYGQGMTRGKVAIMEIEASTNQACAAIIPDRNVSSEFLFQYLSMKYLDIRNIGHGGNQKNLSAGLIKKIALFLPPIHEQNSICRYLSLWDAAVKKTEGLIAAKEKQMSWLRQCMLTSQKRFNGRQKSWKSVPLSELIKQRNEASQGEEEVFSVSVHKGLVNQIEHLGRSFSAKDTGHYNLVRPGDVVYTKSPTGDFPFGIVKQSTVDKAVIVSPLYGVYVPNSYDIGTLLDFFFESDVNARNYLRPLIQKGAKNTISITNEGFLKGEIKFPTGESEIADMATLIRTAREEVCILHKTLEKYKEQKRGLMQKLLSGEWRIKTKEAA